MAAGDVKLVHLTSVAYDIDIASLATSSTRLTGVESTSVAHVNTWHDLLIGGKIRTGSSAPTINTFIEIGVVMALDDTPTWPDVFDGTKSAETITDDVVKEPIVKLFPLIKVDATANRDYPFGPWSMRELLGGSLPTDHVIWVSHNIGQNLDSTAGNHFIKYTPVTFQIEQ